MKDEEKGTGGYDQVAQEHRRGAAVQAVGQLRRMDGKNKERRGNPKGQAKVCPRSYVADNFLMTSFGAKLIETEHLSVCSQRPTIESDFATSLEELTALHKIEPMATDHMAFPYNIAYQCQHIREKLIENRVAGYRDIRLVEHQKHIFFAKQESYCVGMVLYYVPVQPIHDMFDDHKRRDTLPLLLSVYSYLFTVVRVPYFTNQSSYLYDVYERLAEEEFCEEGEEMPGEFADEVEQIMEMGRSVQLELCDPVHLDQFEDRVRDFKDFDGFDAQCHQVAKKFLQLYIEFPIESIYRNIREDRDIDVNSEERVIELGQYLSFCASNSGALFDALFNDVNLELQEICAMQEPTIFIPLDGREIKGNDLDFEKRFFDLIEELTCIVTDYKNN